MTFFLPTQYIVVLNPFILAFALCILLLYIYTCSKHYTSVMYLVCFQLDILLNGRVVDALASVVHRDKAYSTGKVICVKLKDVIHR